MRKSTVLAMVVVLVLAVTAPIAFRDWQQTVKYASLGRKVIEVNKMTKDPASVGVHLQDSGILAQFD